MPATTTDTIVLADDQQWLLNAQGTLRRLADQDGEGEWDCTTQETQRVLFARWMFRHERINEGIV